MKRAERAELRMTGAERAPLSMERAEGAAAPYEKSGGSGSAHPWVQIHISWEKGYVEIRITASKKS